MRIVLLFLFVTSVFAAPSPPGELSPRFLSNSMKEALEKLRKLMITGDPSRDIPIMDPMKLDVFDFKFNTTYLSMSIDSKKNVIKGLSDFVVHNIDITLLPSPKITFDLTLPKTLITSELYDFLGMVFHALPIYGKGLASWDFGKLYGKGSTTVAVGGNGVSLKDLDLELSVQSVVSKTTGMLGGGDIDNVINAIIADLAPDFLNMNSKLIAAATSDFLLGQLNGMLEGMSLNDLVQLITGGSQ